MKSLVENQPVKNVLIILRDRAREAGGVAYTDGSGKYSIVGVAPGMYEVSALWPAGGFISKQVIVEKGKSSEINFEFDKPVPISWNIWNIINAFFSFFTSEVYGAESRATICGGSFLVMVTGPYACELSQVDALKNACSSIKTNIDTSPKMRKRVKKKLQDKLTLGGIVLFCDNDCAVSEVLIDCAVTESSRRVRMCSSAFIDGPPCGCLQAKLFHELLHTTYFSYRDEVQAYSCEKSIYPCGKIANAMQKFASKYDFCFDNDDLTMGCL